MLEGSYRTSQLHREHFDFICFPQWKEALNDRSSILGLSVCFQELAFFELNRVELENKIKTKALFRIIRSQVRTQLLKGTETTFLSNVDSEDHEDALGVMIQTEIQLGRINSANHLMNQLQSTEVLDRCYQTLCDYHRQKKDLHAMLCTALLITDQAMSESILLFIYPVRRKTPSFRWGM